MPNAVTLPQGWGITQVETESAHGVLTVPDTVTKAEADAWLFANTEDGKVGGWIIDGTVVWYSKEFMDYRLVPHILPPPLGEHLPEQAHPGVNVPIPPILPVKPPLPPGGPVPPPKVTPTTEPPNAPVSASNRLIAYLAKNVLEFLAAAFILGVLVGLLSAS